MSHTTKYATKGAIYLGIGGLVANGLKQLFEYLSLENKEEFKFNWKELAIWGAGGAVVGAGGGAIIGAVKDSNASEALKGGPSAYLLTILNKIQNESSPKVERAINRLIKGLNVKFDEYLYEPATYHGSSTRGTDTINSDLDIRMGFKQTIGTMEDMFESLLEFLQNEFSDRYLFNVRRQNKSVGVFYNIDGEEFKVDVVPMRSTGKKNSDAFLYVNGSTFGKAPSRVKSNPRKQSKHLVFTKREIEVIQILKNWKATEDINIGSLYIEFLVKEAFGGRRLTNSLNKRLLFVLEFVKNNIESMRIVDPGNTNNIISNTLTKDEKTSIANKIEKMLKEINGDERLLVDHFALTET